MQGFVSAEKQKFERLASKMKNKERDLAIKNQKLKQVEELIKNSPCVTRRATRNPLRDKNESQSCDETVCLLYSAIPYRNLVSVQHSSVALECCTLECCTYSTMCCTGFRKIGAAWVHFGLNTLGGAKLRFYPLCWERMLRVRMLWCCSD